MPATQSPALITGLSVIKYDRIKIAHPAGYALIGGWGIQDDAGRVWCEVDKKDGLAWPVVYPRKQVVAQIVAGGLLEGAMFLSFEELDEVRSSKK